MYNFKLGLHVRKLKLCYFGPYQIIEEFGQGTFQLRDIFGTPVQKLAHVFRLKNIYGHVLDILRWMINKVSDVGFKYVEVEVIE